MASKDGNVLVISTGWIRGLVIAGWLAGVQASAAAAPVFPEHLTGTWATAESLFSGTEAQAEVHLAADGFGIMAGSTPAPVRLDGVKDDKPAPRGIVGFPLRAEMDGARLKLQLLMPPGQRMKAASQVVVVCTYKPDPATLTCLPPSGAALVMYRRSVSVEPEAALQIEQLRQAL